MAEHVEPLEDDDALTDHELQSYVDGSTTFLDLYIMRLMARDLLIARAILERGCITIKTEHQS